MAKSKKFYVVWEGRKPGIYKTWDECQRQIAGQKGARFKSFKTYEQALHYFKNPHLVPNEPKDKKPKYYVIWKGVKPGIYTDWNEAKRMIQGVEGGAKYKTFGSRALAEKAYLEGPTKYEGKDYKKTRDLTDEELAKIGKPIPLSLAVDAAASGRTKQCEYQGVITETGTHCFHAGPFEKGTNNIGEFLAIVHGLAYLQQHNLNMPIYSDSRIAMGWVQKGYARTQSDDPKTMSLIKRAEKWLKDNSFRVPILKWETKAWGEIPADFGRK